MSKLTLNVGCGKLIFDEYPEGYKCINYDARELPGVNVTGDIRDLPFPDKHFDYILANDIIEHLPIEETENLLKEWYRVLQVGGVIEIKTPNMKWAVEHYTKYRDAKFVSFHIFGGQDYPGNFHYVMFDKMWLRNIIAKNGFFEIEYKESGSNFIMKVMKMRKN